MDADGFLGHRLAISVRESLATCAIGDHSIPLPQSDVSLGTGSSAFITRAKIMTS